LPQLSHQVCSMLATGSATESTPTYFFSFLQYTSNKLTHILVNKVLKMVNSNYEMPCLCRSFLIHTQY
jgi:hypothetical protein